MKDNRHEDGPPCYWRFVEDADPVLSAYCKRPDHTDATRYAFLMGSAAGRLHAIYTLGGYKLDGKTDDLEYALDMYLAVLKALLRCRSPRDFTVALERQNRTRRDERFGLAFEKPAPNDTFLNDTTHEPHDPDVPGGEDDHDAA